MFRYSLESHLQFRLKFCGHVYLHKLFKVKTNYNLRLNFLEQVTYESNFEGGTKIWFEQGCAAQASKPIPIFKGHLTEKVPFSGIFLEI